MRGLSVAVLMLGACATARADSAWQAEVDAHGLRWAEVTGSASVGTAESAARLRLQCRPGTQGTVIWRLTVVDTALLAPFDFGAYEGPDAPGMNLTGTTLTAEGGMLRAKAHGAVGGYFSGSPNEFSLDLVAMANDASDVAFVADAVDASTRELVWRTRDVHDEAVELVARFPGAGAAAALAATMPGCGPVPAFAEGTPAAWLGRNPQAVNLLAQRPLRWRMQAALGRHDDDFVARLAQAEPLGSERGVYFVIAPAGGAAILFDNKAQLEAIWIADGTVQRARLFDVALPTPAAVREWAATQTASPAPDEQP
jgi:hypothetical protein